jgi:hypothetical protein
LALVAAALITWRYPVYFRGDDAAYLAWAAAHANPLEAFSPSAAVLFGSYRPLQNLVWWALHHAAGLDPAPYQFAATLLFLLSFVFFFRLAERLASRAVALGSLVAYATVFSFLGYIVFWFSDLTFILEIFFLNLALCWLVRGCLDGGPALALGVVFYFLAALAKEPAALIAPLVLLCFWWSRGATMAPPQRRRTALTAGVLLAVGVLWVLANPYMRHRQLLNAALDSATFVYYARLRWAFYARRLLAGAGMLGAFAGLYLAVSAVLSKSKMSRAKVIGLSLALPAFVALVLRDAPSQALALLVLALAALVITRHPAAPGAVWFVAPLVGLLNVGFFARTYLIEASFGLALVTGAALADWAAWADKLRRLMPPKPRVVATAAVALLAIAGLGMLAPQIHARLQTLQTVSDTRQDFREMVDYIRAQLDQPGATLIVVDYSDLGLLYVDNILDLSDREKAARQKTMTSDELGRFLAVAGARHLAVHNWAWARQNAPTGDVYVVAMNAAEKDFLDRQGQPLHPVREIRRGQTGAWLFSRPVEK